jgi:RNA polymerase sigma-70 factor (ECF subfamily)
MGAQSKKYQRPESAELSDWLRRAASRDIEAQDNLLTFYRPLLLKLANDRLQGSIRRKVAPSDLVQVTSLKATQGFGTATFANRHGFIAWLKSLLQNEANAIHRFYRLAKKRDISREQSLDGSVVRERVSQLAAEESEPHGVSSNSIDDLMLAIARLPVHYEFVLRLRYYENLSFAAIGKKIDRSSDAARILHQRALKRLAGELEGVQKARSRDTDAAEGMNSK